MIMRDPDEHQRFVDGKRTARMARVDALSPELRALVHEYGYNIVDNFIRLGVPKPKHIRHLVEMVLDEFSPTRGAYSRQGIRTEVGAHPAAAKLDDAPRG